MSEISEYITQIGYLGWFSFGLILVLLEMAVPGVYLIWFGCSAFVMGGLVSFLNLTATEIGVIFALVSAVCAGIGHLIYTKIIHKTTVDEKYKYLNNMAGAYIGKTYVLSEDAVDGRSKARIGDGFWIVSLDENLKKGDRVKITGIEDGVILKAEAVKK